MNELRGPAADEAEAALEVSVEAAAAPFEASDPAAVARVLQEKGFRMPGKHVALVRAAAAQKIGSLFVPDTAQKAARKGVIVMLGKLVTKDVKVSDGALLQLYEATLVKAVVGTVEIVLEILHEDDILMTYPSGFVFEAAFVPEHFDPTDL